MISRQLTFLNGLLGCYKASSMAHTLIQSTDTWLLWALMIAGVAGCIYLEQNFKWAAKTSGPGLALLGGMLLSNSRLMPTEASAYDMVEIYLVPLAIPLLLFRADAAGARAASILRQTCPQGEDARPARLKWWLDGIEGLRRVGSKSNKPPYGKNRLGQRTATRASHSKRG